MEHNLLMLFIGTIKKMWKTSQQWCFWSDYSCSWRCGTQSLLLGSTTEGNSLWRSGIRCENIYCFAYRYTRVTDCTFSINIIKYRGNASVFVADDFEPLDDNTDYEIVNRNNSAVHIRVFRKFSIGTLKYQE